MNFGGGDAAPDWEPSTLARCSLEEDISRINFAGGEIAISEVRDCFLDKVGEAEDSVFGELVD